MPSATLHEHGSPALRNAIHPLTGAESDYDPLIELAGGARFVLLGEASHGTHEFYRARAEITQRLIQEKGFTAVAVEADWPDAYRVNCYVRGSGADRDAEESLRGFQRFPAWMWRNADMLDFIGWLRDYNDHRTESAKVGFYGLDLYSLHTSIEAVLGYLEKIDPAAARQARARYACFDRFGEDSQTYGYMAGLGLSRSCEDEVVQQLTELRRRAAGYIARDGRAAADEFFFVEQNARLVKNAEQYYRSMFQGRVSSWNLRDRHMTETLENLVGHLGRTAQNPRIVVWAHNSHLGDARATDMARRGELNIGQLVRQKHPSDTLLVGFTTYHGTVTAASDWGEAAERRRVRPALPGSFEALFHNLQTPGFLLNLRDLDRSELQEPLLERAIGVIYRPDTERASHYFHAQLPAQFDAVLHLDETRAVEPLERTAQWEIGEVPETFPSGI